MNKYEIKDFFSNFLDNLESFVFFLISVVFLGFFIFYSFQLVRAIESLSWPSVIGEINTYNSDDQTGFHRRIVCSPVVEYKYIVNHETYNNENIALYPVGLLPTECARANEEFWPKKKVIVYYDPKNPDFSILWRDIVIQNYIYIFIFGFLSYLFFQIGIWFWSTAPSNYVVPVSKPTPPEEVQKQSKIEVKEDPSQEKFWS